MSANECVRTVWDWRAASQPAGPVHRKRNALIEFAVMCGVASLLYFRFEKIVIPSIVSVMACLTLIGGLFYPPLYEGIKRFGMWLAKVVGVGLSWLLLVPFFYICFPFGRLVQLLTGKDPLCRKCPTDEKTYWVQQKPVSGPEHYTKQYESRG